MRPVLGLYSAIAITIGGVIGSGVFLKPQQIAIGTDGKLGLILGLWIVGGLVILCGALALAELGAMLPRAGGTYVFLREAYGPGWAFTWAWAEFWVIRSGAIATLGAALATAVAEALASVGCAAPHHTWVAVGAIVVLSAVNMAGVAWGGAVQNVTTTVKILFVLLLAALPFLAIGRAPVEHGPLWPTAVSVPLLTGIGAALSGILWTYDGWAGLPIVAEEVRNPERNVPRGLVIGIVALVALYFGANLAYHVMLPMEQVRQENSAATAAADKLLSPLVGSEHFGRKLTLAMLAVSIFGALNTNILLGPRVLFAAARDHAFLGPLRRIDPRFGTPAVAIAASSLWSVLLVLAGDLSRDPTKRLYDVLSDYCVFGASIFYLLSVAAVFVLRRKRPDAPRPYRTRGYPWVPSVFVAAYGLFLVLMFTAAMRESLMGLTLIAAGVAVYLVARRRPG